MFLFIQNDFYASLFKKFVLACCLLLLLTILVLESDLFVPGRTGWLNFQILRFSIFYLKTFEKKWIHCFKIFTALYRGNFIFGANLFGLSSSFLTKLYKIII